MSARILVVDDILPNVKLLEAKLNSEYYDVITATNGEEAIKKTREEMPDLILLDIMMPGMDGFEVCRRIKQEQSLSHIPIVMVTALTDNVDKVKGLEVGADDFLSKPVNDTALMARVSSLVRLKMTVDEWRARENTANQLGVTEGSKTVMDEPADNAKVLVVEDQSFEVDKIVDTLHRDNDNVIPVDSGMNAMEYVSQHDFDLLVISINLKNEDGLRLCSHLRSNEKTRSVPILMVATEDDMDRVARGMEIGAHDYILRPVDRNELLARARTQIRKKRFQERLRQSYEYSISMALTDSLTGLYNRRYFDAHIVKMMQNHAASNKNLGVLYLDIDHFKKVNDEHGHNVGDEVLKTFAHRLQDNLRGFDLVVRLGGEEFVVILPDTSINMAQFIAERLRRAIAEKPFKCSVEGGELSVTTSIGGTVIKPGEHENAQEILDRADKCLFEAKNAGRNRVVFENVGVLDSENIYKAESKE